MKVKVYKQDGSESGKSVTLDKAVFAVDPNDHAIWLDVRRIQAAARQGTHKAKERNEVAGSTKKMYRQKGTGFARAGSRKSPIRKTGGRTFGPRPRAYVIKVNRKTQKLARRSAFSYKATADAIRVVEDFVYDTPDTNELSAFLAKLDLAASRVLLVTGEHAGAVNRSGKNISRLTVRAAGDVSTLDVMKAQVVVMQEGALKTISERLTANRK
jgi:large subunit ribosomal protein L4